MSTRSDGPELTIELLREIEARMLERPVLQAIAIYDCEATKDSVVVLEHKVEFISVVLIFKEEAGPVIRWFFNDKGSLPWDHLDYTVPKHEVVPINRYGCAAVMSSSAYRQYESLMQEQASRAAPGTASALNLLLPRVYDLNKDKRDGNSVAPSP